jgi:polyisoprenoid-binding protein YceI
MQFAAAIGSKRKSRMHLSVIALITYLSLRSAVALGPAEAIPNQATTLAVDRGSVSFSVKTNALGLSLTGKSDALGGSVELRKVGDGVFLDRVEAWLPVKTLETGMKLRDEHMRKHVFDKPNGESPDLRFEAGDMLCSGLAPGREASCPVSGLLAIRGNPRPFATSLKIRQDSANVFRIRGASTVKLSDYGIGQPSQLGVKTDDEVQVRIEFTVRPGVFTSMRRAASR